MTRFYDDNQILEITLTSKDTGEDFSSDFFEDACDRRNYNECLEAYKVDDVDYLLDFAQSYLDGTNPDIDYPEDWEPEYYLDYSVEERPTAESEALEDGATSLYVGGWRAQDREAIQKEYGLTDGETDIIVDKLKEYEEQ
nr:MAG TPA: hypothetical protein [Caudoviricetes sp.]